VCVFRIFLNFLSSASLPVVSHHLKVSGCGGGGNAAGSFIRVQKCWPRKAEGWRCCCCCYLCSHEHFLRLGGQSEKRASEWPVASIVCACAEEEERGSATDRRGGSCAVVLGGLFSMQSGWRRPQQSGIRPMRLRPSAQRQPMSHNQQSSGIVDWRRTGGSATDATGPASNRALTSWGLASLLAWKTIRANERNRTREHFAAGTGGPDNSTLCRLHTAFAHCGTERGRTTVCSPQARPPAPLPTRLPASRPSADWRHLHTCGQCIVVAKVAPFRNNTNNNNNNTTN